jgi:putative membrane protein
MPSEQRLHPSSILFSFGKSLKALVVPALVVLVFGRSSESAMRWWPGGPRTAGAEFWALLLLIPAAAAAVARYLSFRIRYEGSELVIRQGVIFRSERHVPYARIQNLDAVRNVFHRVLGVTEVRVETGGGSEPEATISVLPLAAFEEMRGRVFADRPPGSVARGAPAPFEPSSVTFLKLPPRELLLLGFVDNRGFVLIGALIGALWQVDLLDRIGAATLEWMGWSDSREALRAGARAAANQAAIVIAAAAAVFLVARVVSMTWAVVRFHGFELRRIGDDLRTEYGLFTRVAATIPIYRVQTLTIWQGPLQRVAGRQAISVETAGTRRKDEGGRSERPWLAPIVRTNAVADVARRIMPELDLSSLEWRPVHPRAFRRVLLRSALLALALSAISSLWLGWTAFGPLAAGLLIAVPVARQQVQNLRWTSTEDLVVFRSGWLWKRLTAARTTKVQTVTLAESPFDRGSAMAAVHVDTAGAGPQSHRVRIPYLDRSVASTLHRALAIRAAATTFRW